MKNKIFQEGGPEDLAKVVRKKHGQGEAFIAGKVTLVGLSKEMIVRHLPINIVAAYEKQVPAELILSATISDSGPLQTDEDGKYKTFAEAFEDDDK